MYIIQHDRTQIQIPDELYREAKRVANQREWFLAELCRRGLEYMINISPKAQTTCKTWVLPEPRPLGGRDPFADPDWREDIHIATASVSQVTESKARYEGRERGG